jgi:hypothetical protein
LRRLALLSALAACRLHFDEHTGWSTPTPLPEASSSTVNEEDPTLSADGLTLVYIAEANAKDIFLRTRPSPISPWSAPTNLTINSANNDLGPRLSVDALTLYFASLRSGHELLYQATRPQPTEFANPTPIPETDVGTGAERWLSPCEANRYVMVHVTLGNEDLFEGTLGAQPPTLITELQAAGYESAPFLTPDCLSLYFSSDRNGTRDLFVSTRATLADAWSPPQPLDGVNDPLWADEDPCISADGRTLMFASDRAGMGNYDIYFSTRFVAQP